MQETRCLGGGRSRRESAGDTAAARTEEELVSARRGQENFFTAEHSLPRQLEGLGNDISGTWKPWVPTSGEPMAAKALRVKSPGAEQ